MPHFATTALIRKRTVEKRSDKHNEKTLKNYGTSDENPPRFLHPFWIQFLMDFDFNFAQFLNSNS